MNESVQSKLLDLLNAVRQSTDADIVKFSLTATAHGSDFTYEVMQDNETRVDFFRADDKYTGPRSIPSSEQSP